MQDSNINTNSNEYYNKILHLYNIEFIDECSDVLNKKETEFLRHFFNKMNLILQNEYGNEAYDDISFSKTIKSIEKKVYDSLYLPMKTSCTSILDAFNAKSANKKRIDSYYLTNFRSHCTRNTIPLHTCKGRFIESTDSRGKPQYVICINCKQCYTDTAILMHCTSCNINYYSSIVSISDKVLLPATWEKYHCNAVMNEQMRCIRCQDLFYLKNNSLYCKSCKYLTSPLDVVWKCLVCKKEFKSYAKVYNPLEFKMIKITIKNALLYKILVKPIELPCGCKGNPLTLSYGHKSQCRGLLYYGEYNGKDMIICSSCKAAASYNKFYWTCPLCTKTFRTKKIKIFLKEDEGLGSSNLLFNEITQQLEKKGNKDKLFFSPEYLKSSLSLRDDLSPANNSNLNPNANANIRHFPNQYSNFTAMGAIENIDLTDTGTGTKLKPFEDQRDTSKPRNLSINLRERSGSKKKEDISQLMKKNAEDNDDDEIPYYSTNRNHISKRNDKDNKEDSIQSIGGLTTRRNHSQQKTPIINSKAAIDNNTNIDLYSTNSNSKQNDQGQLPSFKCHYKNYQKCIPQRTINLGDNNNDNEGNSPNSERIKGLNADNGGTNVFSLTAGNFHRFKSNRLDRNYSNERKNPFKLINKESLAEKEEMMGNSKRTHEKPNNKHSNQKSGVGGGGDGEQMANIQLHVKHNQSMIDNDKASAANIVKNLERELNVKSSDKKDRERGNSGKKDKDRDRDRDNIKSINIDLLDNEANDTDDQNTELNTINIDDYTIITLLGQGTFGKIYLVEDIEQNIYSLKKIVLTEELDIELILKEYQLVHYLQHSNIIKIIGYCYSKLDFASFVIYILMEVGLGDWEKEIKNHIDKQLHYTEREIINILSQLVSALAFLQTKNVSHRDIKPGNVLVFKDSVYKIADFGEAKKVTQTQQNKQINTLRGTELYMSPLLFNGIKTNQLDIKHNLYKSDVFSLGLCIVYAMALSTNVIYDIRKIVDSKIVKVFLGKVFSKRYSGKLLEVIGSMLEINEAYRCDFLELEKKVEVLMKQETN